MPSAANPPPSHPWDNFSAEEKLLIDKDPRYFGIFSWRDPKSYPPMPRRIKRSSLPKEIAKTAIIPKKYPYAYRYKDQIYFQDKFYFEYELSAMSRGSHLLCLALGELLQMDPNMHIYLHLAPGPSIPPPKGLEHWVPDDHSPDLGSMRITQIGFDVVDFLNEMKVENPARVHSAPFTYGGLSKVLTDDRVIRADKLQVMIIPFIPPAMMFLPDWLEPEMKATREDWEEGY